MKNKKKGSRCNRNKSDPVMLDGFTKLPDGVLLNILDRLNTPDAVRTCLLSKRTLHLRHMLSNLHIRINSFVPRCGYATLKDTIPMNAAVADATDNILSFRRQDIPLRKLSIGFFLRYYDCLTIGKAVARAMATHNIHSAEFNILTEKPPDYSTIDDHRRDGKQLMTFFCACTDAFAGLTRLHLRNLKLAETDIPNIIATCKRLEYLRLALCQTEDSVLLLQLEHPRLVELDISNANLELIELNSLPNLKRLGFGVWVYPQEPLSFCNVQLLSSLSLTNVAMRWHKVIRLSQFLANIPFVKDLHLNFASEKIWVHPECPKLLEPVLQNLQVLSLDELPEECDIAWTRFFLEAAPSLKEICITVWDHWCEIETDKVEREKQGYCDKTNVEWESSAPDGFRHYNLTKLTIYGFQPNENFTGYIRHVMEAAVNLEDISLYDRKVLECCEELDPKIKVVPSRYPQTIEEQELLRKQITEGLVMASPHATRELAIQLTAEATVLLKYHQGIVVQNLIGDTKIQEASFCFFGPKRCCSVIPPFQVHGDASMMLMLLISRGLASGRISPSLFNQREDHIENNSSLSARLMGLELLVLDEAVHLLDLGFLTDIEKIVDSLPRQRQTLLFSATIPKEVRRVSQLVLKRDDVFVDTVGLGAVETPTKMIVFCTTAMMTEFMYIMLRDLKLNVREIHSRKPQHYRTLISEEFRDSSRLILVTSDVSTRGVNYPVVTLVIQV
uniref:F-box domain-containing protein n=1 Tax=Oryza glumipatula TaxID=40148 RepID=A0A0D9Z0F6_9ORYZ